MLRWLSQPSLLELSDQLVQLDQQIGLGTVTRTRSVLQPREARHLLLFVEQTQVIIVVQFATHS